MFSFLALVMRWAREADEAALMFTKLASNSENQSAADSLLSVMQVIRERSLSSLDALLQHLPFFTEMLLCRVVDSYLTYISNMLSLIFRTKPETMKSQEQVTIEDILEHKTIDDLISYLAESRVNELSYRGMRELSSYLRKRIGFNLLAEDRLLEDVVQIIEVRNLIVHNRGIINRIFLSRVPSYAGALGDHVNIDLELFFYYSDTLARAVHDMDVRAADKFSLPRTVSHEQLRSRSALMVERLLTRWSFRGNG